MSALTKDGLNSEVRHERGSGCRGPCIDAVLTRRPAWQSDRMSLWISPWHGCHLRISRAPTQPCRECALLLTDPGRRPVPPAIDELHTGPDRVATSRQAMGTPTGTRRTSVGNCARMGRYATDLCSRVRDQGHNHLGVHSGDSATLRPDPRSVCGLVDRRTHG